MRISPETRSEIAAILLLLILSFVMLLFVAPGMQESPYNMF